MDSKKLNGILAIIGVLIIIGIILYKSGGNLSSGIIFGIIINLILLSGFVYISFFLKKNNN